MIARTRDARVLLRFCRIAAVFLFFACGSSSQSGGPEPGYGAGGSGGDPVINCDADGDGLDGTRCGGPDCDDTDPAVHPDAEERCDNDIDDDCDGSSNEGCGCRAGEARLCYPPGENSSTRDVGACSDGVQRCGDDGTWSGCEAAVLPAVETSPCDPADPACDGVPSSCFACAAGAVEICGNGLDDDCSGVVDDPATCYLDCRPYNPRGENPPELSCCGDGSCTNIDCDGRLDQPCYSGPPVTLGVGVCRGGLHSCEEPTDGSPRHWGACVGEVLPGVELCGNGFDDDCDGRIDEDDGATGRRCDRSRVCQPDPTEECGNGLDDDCDGFPDDGCEAAGAEQPCWSGALANRGVGACTDGVQRRDATRGWGPCEGQVLPNAETCGDGIDSDCNGLGGAGLPEDPGCCILRGEELCNGLDDDCDGLVDEGVLNRCGTCAGPCWEEGLDLPGTCNVPGRTCEGLVPHSEDVEAFQLGARTDLWESLAGWNFDGDADRLTRFTIDGQFLWEQTSATAGNFAADGSVWLRLGADVGTSDGTLLHIGADGSVLCTLTGLPSNGLFSWIAFDASGDIWTLETFDSTRYLARIHGSATRAARADGSPWPDGLPRCLLVDEVSRAALEFDDLRRRSVDGVNIFVNGLGIVWTDYPTLTRFDTLSGDSFIISTPPGSAVTRITGVSSPWDDAFVHITGGFSGLDVYRIEPDFPFASRDVLPGSWSDLVATPDAIWALPSQSVLPENRRIVRLRADTLEPTAWIPAPNPGLYPVWTAELPSGRLLTRDPARQFDPSIGGWVDAPVPLPFYRTNSTAIRLAQRYGALHQVFDSRSYRTSWRTLRWTQATPGASRLATFVRFSDDPDTFDLSPDVCGPFLESPADLGDCAPSDGRRFARVEHAFYADARGNRPAVRDTVIAWDVP